jgi:hypothetical protein
VSTDDPEALILKVGVKEENGLVDAFWLEHPARLVVDVFPKGSPRESGPQVLGGGRVARHSAGAAKPRAKEESSGYVCYPANAQVNAMVNEGSHDGLELRLDTAAIAGSHDSANGIHCYPAKSQLQASIVYEPGKTSEPAKASPAAAAETPAASPAAETKAAAPSPEVAKAQPTPSEATTGKQDLLGSFHTELLSPAPDRSPSSSQAPKHSLLDAGSLINVPPSDDTFSQRIPRGSLLPPIGK